MTKLDIAEGLWRLGHETRVLATVLAGRTVAVDVDEFTRRRLAQRMGELADEYTKLEKLVRGHEREEG